MASIHEQPSSPISQWINRSKVRPTLVLLLVALTLTSRAYPQTATGAGGDSSKGTVDSSAQRTQGDSRAHQSPLRLKADALSEQERQETVREAKGCGDAVKCQEVRRKIHKKYEALRRPIIQELKQTREQRRYRPHLHWQNADKNKSRKAVRRKIPPSVSVSTQGYSTTP